VKKESKQKGRRRCFMERSIFSAGDSSFLAEEGAPRLTKEKGKEATKGCSPERGREVP